tara:strand:- start:5631 stop:6203 length:573 start_codon:yes stop_codon:yes gene_type:complete
MSDDSIINLGQFPRRTFEDLRLQTQSYLDNCAPEYFHFYPSHPGIVIRHLHDQLVGFARFAVKSGLRCLMWGCAGDVAHIQKFLDQFSFEHEIHAVVDNEEDMSWVQAQTTATVWLEKNEEQYCSPPYASPDYFNCVLIMGWSRDKCLAQVERYIARSAPHLLLVVDEVPSCCDSTEGSHYLGGPVWRGA